MIRYTIFGLRLDIEDCKHFGRGPRRASMKYSLYEIYFEFDHRAKTTHILFRPSVHNDMRACSHPGCDSALPQVTVLTFLFRSHRAWCSDLVEITRLVEVNKLEASAAIREYSIHIGTL